MATPMIPGTGLGDLLGRQVAGETDEERKRRMAEQQQQQRTGTNSALSSALGYSRSSALGSIFGGAY
jgi:hypothetical protein